MSNPLFPSPAAAGANENPTAGSSPIPGNSPGNTDLIPTGNNLALRPQPKIGFGSAALAEHVDLTSDATVVASALQQARGKGLFDGLASLTRLRFETWLEERMKGPILHQLAIRREVAEAQKGAEEAQNKLKGTQHDGSRSVERYQIDMVEMRRQRMLSDLTAAVVSDMPPQLGAASSAAPAPPTHITEEQVEALALRAAMQLGAAAAEDGGESEEATWQLYRTELYARLPVNLAQEVERRIQEIRAVTR
jgi:hypothetical protein